MKCSEYLWKYLDLQSHAENLTDIEAAAQLSMAMAKNGDTTIVSNTTGERMEADEALSVLGRYAQKGGKNKLLDAYHNGQKSLFELLVTNKNLSDDEYEAAKKAEEEAAQAHE